MKQLLFALLLLPAMAAAQPGGSTKQSDFEGWKISDCQYYAISELAKADKGVMSAVAANRVLPTTKTIYIAKRKWLQEVHDTTFNGIAIKLVDVDSNIKTIASDVRENGAAVYYISPFEPKATTCEMWVFPIDVTKSKKKPEGQFATTVYKMNFFFNYDPPVYEYHGTDAVVLE